jgi:hypothetical protein
MKHLFTTVVILAYAATTNALGTDISYDSFAAKHFPSIEHAETCGTWQLQGKRGQFRFFTASLYGANMLFVDMVRPDESGALNIIEHGFSIPEIDNDHADISITKIRCTPLADSKIRLTGTAENGHKGSKFSFCVLVDAKTKALRYLDSQRIKLSLRRTSCH